MTSRKFLLYNSEDDLVDLNNHEIFVLNPTGLGVSFSNSFSNVSANFLQEKSVFIKFWFATWWLIVFPDVPTRYAYPFKPARDFGFFLVSLW